MTAPKPNGHGEQMERLIETLDAAIDEWGEQTQKDIAIEEMAELIRALSRERQGRAASSSDVVEEIADVHLCLGQLERMYGKKEVRWEFRRKHRRLRKRLGIDTDAE